MSWHGSNDFGAIQLRWGFAALALPGGSAARRCSKRITPCEVSWASPPLVVGKGAVIGHIELKDPEERERCR